MRMTIQLNGQRHEIDACLSISQLLDHEALPQRRVAVEVNGHIIPRSQHPQYQLQDGDKVEIVHALGGG